jgi:hypothetical protein
VRFAIEALLRADSIARSFAPASVRDRNLRDVAHLRQCRDSCQF